MTLAPLYSHLMNGPAMRPVALAESFLHLLAAPEPVKPKAFVERDGGEGWGPYQIHKGVALIHVEGMLVPGTGWIGYRYRTGYGDIEMQVAAALGDPAIDSVVLAIDSGGGHCEGLWEFCAWLVAARGDKPIVAICKYAYSAAYAVASACDRVIVAPMGGVGSIGTLMVHMEITGVLENFGVAVDVIRDPDGKARGGMLEQLDPATRATFHAMVAELTALFADHVATQRGIARETVLGTDAACFELPSGTARALALGLVDAVTEPGDALAELADFTPAAPAA